MTNQEISDYIKAQQGGVMEINHKDNDTGKNVVTKDIVLLYILSTEVLGFIFITSFLGFVALFIILPVAVLVLIPLVINIRFHKKSLLVCNLNSVLFKISLAINGAGFCFLQYVLYELYLYFSYVSSTPAEENFGGIGFVFYFGIFVAISILSLIIFILGFKRNLKLVAENKIDEASYKKNLSSSKRMLDALIIFVLFFLTMWVLNLFH